MTSTDNMKTLVVANPNSASGALGRNWPFIADRIRSSFGSFDHLFTAGSKDATRLTRKALMEGYEMVVALGGDGTISEVVNGFFDRFVPVNPEGVLGILPFGTGGDFRKTLKLSKKLEESAHALRGRACRAVDVGRLIHLDHDGLEATTYFINIASFGMGGLVDRYVNTAPKQLGGLLSFLVATIRATAVYRNQSIRLVLDGAAPMETRVLNVAVANGQYFGGGMHVAPWAQLDDGLFDVVVLGDFTPWEMLTRGYKVYTGGHMCHPKVRFQRARQVRAEPSNAGEAVLLDVDGETPGRLPATFDMLAGSIRIKVA